MEIRHYIRFYMMLVPALQTTLIHKDTLIQMELLNKRDRLTGRLVRSYAEALIIQWCQPDLP